MYSILFENVLSYRWYTYIFTELYIHIANGYKYCGWMKWVE